MNILFIVTSFWAYGELLIALDFAKACELDGINTHFMIPPTHRSILESKNISYTSFIPKSRKINRLLMQDIELRYSPKYIILSDFLNYHFCEKHYGVTQKDLELFNGNIGTFDNFDWKYPRLEMDTYGFKSDTVRNVSINDYGFQLMPVPIVNIDDSKTDNHQKKYALINEYLTYTLENKQKYRQELNIPLDKKVILTTIATWQQGYKAYPGVEKFIKASDEIFEMLLNDLSNEYVVIVVGKKETKGVQKNKNLIKEGKLIMLDSLPTDIFEKYAISCDLFITRNITSTTTIKLVLSKIPCLQIRNTYSKKQEVLHKFNNLIKDCDYIYRYEMYPVGWYEFLKPILENNPYIDLITRVEQFDWVGLKESVYSLLYNENIKKEKIIAIEVFKKDLKKLPTPPQIIRSL